MLTGLGMYIWKIPYAEKGNVEAIVAAAKAADFSHVILKIADGDFRFNINPARGDMCPPLVRALRQAGLAVWGFHYVYGVNPGHEAQVSIARVRELGLDGLVVDAEKEYKLAGAGPAKTYTKAVKAGLGAPVALSTFRFPTLHGNFPFQGFLNHGIDVVMPQIYWEKASNVGEQLQRCYDEYQVIASGLPFIPTGAAYHWDGWTARPAEIQEFASQARTMGLPAINYWEWDQARIYGLWETIANLRWGAPAAPNPEPKPEPTPVTPGLRLRVRVDTLNVRAGPGTSYPDVGDLHRGDVVEPLAIAGTNAWVQVARDPDRWACVQLGSTVYLEPVGGDHA